MPREVTAFSNSTVKLLRALRDKKARRAEGLFLAEGLRILEEAREAGRLPEIIAFADEGARHPLAQKIIAEVAPPVNMAGCSARMLSLVAAALDSADQTKSA